MGKANSAQQTTADPTSVDVAIPRKRRRRSRSRRSDKSARQKLRTIYFVLAAAWGFVIGTSAVLAGLAAVDRPLEVEPRSLALLIGAGVLALLGGCVAALAYRDASNRFQG